MAPADAADDELINLLRTTLQETPIVLTVVVRLLLGVGATDLATLSKINIGIFALVVVLIKRGKHANNALK